MTTSRRGFFGAVAGVFGFLAFGESKPTYGSVDFVAVQRAVFDQLSSASMLLGRDMALILDMELPVLRFDQFEATKGPEVPVQRVDSYEEFMSRYGV